MSDVTVRLGTLVAEATAERAAASGTGKAAAADGESSSPA